MMQSTSQQLYLPEEETSSQHAHYNGHCGVRNETSELQDCHRTIGQLEQRCVRLESLSQDLERRLREEAQHRVEMEGDMVIREREWEERLNKAQREKQELQVQYRKVERQAKAFQKELMKSMLEVQKHHKGKHDLMLRVKKEALEELRGQERAGRDGRNGTSSGSTPAVAEASSPAGPPVRRMPSSGSLFGKAVSGRVFGNPRSVEPSGIRDNCVNNSLADFFNLRP